MFFSLKLITFNCGSSMKMTVLYNATMNCTVLQCPAMYFNTIALYIATIVQFTLLQCTMHDNLLYCTVKCCNKLYCTVPNNATAVI